MFLNAVYYNSEVAGVPPRYFCPDCKGNRTRFALIYKLAQEIRKDPKTGEILYRADEWEALSDGNGRPHVDVKCLSCGYTAYENVFIKAAKNLDDGFG